MTAQGFSKNIFPPPAFLALNKWFHTELVSYCVFVCVCLDPERFERFFVVPGRDFTRKCWQCMKKNKSMRSRKLHHTSSMTEVFHIW